MTTIANFTCKNSWGDNQIRLFQDLNEIGFIKTKGWTGSSFIGMLKGTTYLFESKGVLSNDFNVFDEQYQLVESIQYSYWKSTVKVFFENRELLWRPTNLFQTKWELVDENGLIVKLDSDFNTGNLISSNENEFLSFLAMFLKFKYSIAVTTIISIIAILMSLTALML